MIRFRLRELMADKSFRDGHPVRMVDVAEATGISRRVLTNFVNVRGYNTETDTVDKLCEYFGCRIEQFLEHVPSGAISHASGGLAQKQKGSSAKRSKK